MVTAVVHQDFMHATCTLVLYSRADIAGRKGSASDTISEHDQADCDFNERDVHTILWLSVVASGKIHDPRLESRNTWVQAASGNHLGLVLTAY